MNQNLKKKKKQQKPDLETKWNWSNIGPSEILTSLANDQEDFMDHSRIIAATEENLLAGITVNSQH